MAATYSNGGNRWNILGFNFTKRDALSSVYKISMIAPGYDAGLVPFNVLLNISEHILQDANIYIFTILLFP